MRHLLPTAILLAGAFFWLNETFPYSKGLLECILVPLTYLILFNY